MNQRDYEYFKGLEDHYNKWDIAFDEILIADMKEIANDDKFFLFEDEVFKVCTLFYRDKYIMDNMRGRPHAPIVGIAGTDRVVGSVPPAGVLPFKGFPYYASALCYLSDKV